MCERGDEGNINTLISIPTYESYRTKPFVIPSDPFIVFVEFFMTFVESPMILAEFFATLTESLMILAESFVTLVESFVTLAESFMVLGTLLGCLSGSYIDHDFLCLLANDQVEATPHGPPYSLPHHWPPSSRRSDSRLTRVQLLLCQELAVREY